MILLTDGTASYAVFIYGSIKGSIQDNKFEPVIGFDTGDKKNGESIFSRIIFSNITGDINNGTIFRIDGKDNYHYIIMYVCVDHVLWSHT